MTPDPHETDIIKSHPFVTEAKPICPPNLLVMAKNLPPTRTAVVCAGFPLPMQSAHQAWSENILLPVFIGNKSEIESYADKLQWNISEFEIIEADGEKTGARAGALLGREGKVDAILKGNLHTDIFMRAMISHKVGVRVEPRFYHLFYISEPVSGRPLIIGDAAVNVSPSIETRQMILHHIDELARATGIARPKIAILSATESEIKTVPSSIEAAELTKWAKQHLPKCDVEGPMALDLILSMKAVEIKGMTNSIVAGKADGVLVPDIVSGNLLFKSLVYLAGGCAAGIVLGGKVPILLTSRADPPAARLASCALASIVRNNT